MCLVINKFSLLFCSFLISKLSSANCIACRHCRWSKECIRSTKDNHNSRYHHYLIYSSRVSKKFEFSLTRNSHKSLQKTGSRNPIVIELNVTIINCIVAHLCTYIAYFQAWKRFVIYSISNRTKKGQRTMIITIYYQPCKYNRVSTVASKCPWPKFCCFNVRRMNDKLIFFFIKCSSCLKPSNIWTVS